MKSVVDQALGDVGGAHTALGLARVTEYTFVQRGRLVRQIVVRLQQGAQIVGIQHRIERGIAQSVAAVSQDVGQRADVHAHVAVEGAHSSDGLRQIVIPGPAIAATNQARLRQERDQVALHRYGTGAGASAAVRSGKRFVQIQMD